MSKDASMLVELNGVRLPDGRVVPWAVAFPRRLSGCGSPCKIRDCSVCGGPDAKGKR